MDHLYTNLRDLTSSDRGSSAFVRLIRAAGMLLIIFLVGSIGYWLGTPEEHTLLDGAFMTMVTITTVGYNEVIPVFHDPWMKVFTMALIVSGMGVTVYFVSTLTALVIDGDLRHLLWRQRMDREIAELDDHFIVAGIGSTGSYVLREMLQTHQPCVVIEADPERIDEELKKDDFLYIRGDATNDDTLERAGITRARGLVTSLGSDRSNLFVTITAHSLNPDLLIVARGEDPQAEQKFKMAGATSVIYTNVLGGARMAAEVTRPQVTSFMELMMQDHSNRRSVEELRVPADSPLIGKTLQTARLRQHTDALVIAVYQHEEGEYVFNPGPDYELSADDKLIVLTLVENIDTLEAIIRGELS